MRDNPGLRAGFGRTLYFPEYSEAELMEHLRRFCTRDDYVLTKEAEATCAAILRSRLRGEPHRNTKLVARVYEEMRTRQALRIDELARRDGREATDTEMTELRAVHVPAAAAG